MTGQELLDKLKTAIVNEIGGLNEPIYDTQADSLGEALQEVFDDVEFLEKDGEEDE